jgi:hypothetical protein
MLGFRLGSLSRSRCPLTPGPGVNGSMQTIPPELCIAFGFREYCSMVLVPLGRWPMATQFSLVTFSFPSQAVSIPAGQQLLDVGRPNQPPMLRRREPISVVCQSHTFCLHSLCVSHTQPSLPTTSNRFAQAARVLLHPQRQNCPMTKSLHLALSCSFCPDREMLPPE